MDEFTDALVVLSQVFAGVALGGLAAGAGYLSWRVSRDAHAVLESVRWLEAERLRRRREEERLLLPIGADSLRCRRSLGQASARLLAHLVASGRVRDATWQALIDVTGVRFEVKTEDEEERRRVLGGIRETYQRTQGSPFDTVEGLLRFIAAFDVAVAEGRQVPLSDEDIRDMAFAQWAYSGQATPVWFAPGPGEPGAEPRQRWWQRFR